MGQGKNQATLPSVFLVQVHEAVLLWAWGNIDTDMKFTGSYSRTLQRIFEPYVEFLGKLSEVTFKHIRGKETQNHLIRLFAFKNANENCQAILGPIRER